MSLTKKHENIFLQYLLLTNVRKGSCLSKQISVFVKSSKSCLSVIHLNIKYNVEGTKQLMTPDLRQAHDTCGYYLFFNVYYPNLK